MPAAALTDPSWLAEQIKVCGRRFGVGARTAGVLWWYSASSVLLGPAAESYVRGGRVADPALGSMTLFLHPDGRVLDARAAASVSRDEAPERVSALVSRCVAAIGTARSLWAIASDSLANRVLWAGGGEADAMALAADERFPVPRFARIGGQLAVRRASCCLVYESPGQGKCVSCPRQPPDDRLRRLREVFGQVT